MLKFRRLIAAYIDFCISFFAGYIPTSIVDDILGDNLLIMDIIGSLISLLFLFLSFWLLFYKDILFKNASIGKKIMGLKIYENNEIPDKKTIFNRNMASFKLGTFYVFYILFTNKSPGDYKYNTEVK